MHLHCSTVTLTEHFRREFGMTIFTYLNNKRLGQAERLLTETEMSISEVAEESGFADANLFLPPVQGPPRHVPLRLPQTIQIPRLTSVER